MGKKLTKLGVKATLAVLPVAERMALLATRKKKERRLIKRKSRGFQKYLKRGGR